MSTVRLCFSPGAVLLFSLFVILTDREVFLASVAAILLHELGHAAALRCLGSGVKTVSANGMGLTMYPKTPLSYGGELLALAAGPVVNILAFLLFGSLGRTWQYAYTLSGAQLILGAFNLLPICGLDGSSILWIFAALLWDPDRADSVARQVSICVSVLLMAFSCLLVCRFRSGFLLLWVSLGLFLRGLRQMGLVKQRRKR